MSLLRPSTMFRGAALRSALATGPRAGVQTRFASGYGNGDGNPKSENPKQQGRNPSEELEHPGPPPPKVARNKSSSSPNENPDQNAQSPGNESQSQSQSKSSSKQSGDGKESSGGKYGVKGAQPKILADNPPAEFSEGVREHNEDMKHRAEKANLQVSNEDAVNDKVPKGYWSGQGGKDRDA